MYSTVEVYFHHHDNYFHQKHHVTLVPQSEALLCERWPKLFQSPSHTASLWPPTVWKKSFTCIVSNFTVEKYEYYFKQCCGLALIWCLLLFVESCGWWFRPLMSPWLNSNGVSFPHVWPHWTVETLLVISDSHFYRRTGRSHHCVIPNCTKRDTPSLFLSFFPCHSCLWFSLQIINDASCVFLQS